MPHAFKNHPEISWPDLEASYVDEFGPIDLAVYELVPRIWPAVVPTIRQTIHDLHDGQRLMMKAVALVSRKLNEQPEKMTSVHGYLFRTFINLLYEECEKETKHEHLERAIHAQGMVSTKERSDKEIYKIILVHEVLERADDKTRKVYELLTLGHSFEEIAMEFNIQGNHLRAQWSKVVRRLAKQIRAETREAEMKFLQRHQGRT